MTPLRMITLLILASCLLGCGTVGPGYLWQATMGQMELFNRARPIEEVLKDRRSSSELRSLLSEVSQIKSFGETRGLSKTSNYEEYVDLKRDAVVWVVAASKPLEFKSKRWSWPIVGSFTYIGWFAKNLAKKHAGRLKKNGWDVYVRGSGAYSSLGWFRDPILSTMFMGENRKLAPSAMGSLVNVVLHESVHASLYIDGQSSFNESVASFAADKMTPHYLKERFGVESAERRAYVESYRKRIRATRLLTQAYQALETLYQSNGSEKSKLERKAQIYVRLKSDLKTKRDLNNAALIQYKTYGQGLKEFEQLFQACGRKWDRFWTTLRTLDEDDFFKSQSQDYGAKVLIPLAKKKCPNT